MSNLSQTETNSESPIGHYSSRTLTIHVIANWWHPALPSGSCLQGCVPTHSIYSTTAQADRRPDPQAWNPAQKSIQPRSGPPHDVGGASVGPTPPSRGTGGGGTGSLVLPAVGCVHSRKGLLMFGHFLHLLLFLEQPSMFTGGPGMCGRQEGNLGCSF